MVRNQQRRRRSSMLRPTFAQLIPNLPRRAQVIYPKDIGPILLWGDIGPGMRVLEVGHRSRRADDGAAARGRPDRPVDLVRDPPRLRRDGARQRAQFYGEAPHWTVVACRRRARASPSATSTAW